jgi:hypothetical protein
MCHRRSLRIRDPEATQEGQRMSESDKEKMETIDAKKIKDLIRAEGIDLVGIADAKDLMLAHPPRPATALMPSAHSHGRGAFVGCSIFARYHALDAQ